MSDKRCSRCRVWKPLSEFNRNRSYPDKLQPYCCMCQAQATKWNLVLNKSSMEELRGLLDHLIRTVGSVRSAPDLTVQQLKFVEQKAAQIKSISKRIQQRIQEQEVENARPQENGIHD